jgi:hypothetical protein
MKILIMKSNGKEQNGKEQEEFYGEFCRTVFSNELK